MKEYLKRRITEMTTGLVTIQTPTGFGKTHSASNAISEFVSDVDENRKIIFLTPLKKNLPDDEIRQFFKDNERLYNSSVLRIRANREEVIEKILSLEVPERFQTELYEQLCKKVKRYKETKAGRINDKDFIVTLEQEIDEAERIFRKDLKRRLAREFNTKEARLQAIHTNREYKWIGELYPAVYTDERQVLLMSVNKFMARNSTVIEPSYDFIKAPFIDNAIIFIDEFDSSKEWILNEIIRRSLAMKNDYITLFRHISRTLVRENISTDIRHAAEQVNGRYSFDDLLLESRAIEERYNTNLSIKVADSDVDRRQNFLLKDGTFHSILNNNKHYIRTAVDEERNQVMIHFETHEEYHKNRTANDLVIYTMLRDIERFLNHFRVFMYSWSENYCQIINRKRASNNLAAEMSAENALFSILHSFDLDNNQQQIIMGELCKPIASATDLEGLLDNSFYQKGIEVFSFKDHDQHYDCTTLEFVQMCDTPERLLVYLAERALVFGISATAEIRTVVGNYNLSYIKDKLRQNYIAMDKDLEEKVHDELTTKWKPYEEGKVKIHTKIVADAKAGFSLVERCNGILEDEEYANIVANKISYITADEYYQRRYMNIVEVMQEYAGNSNINSFLYLGMAIPKKYDPNMNEELLEELVGLINKYMRGVDKEYKPFSLFVLKSENFDEDKEVLVNRLASGEKIFIMSTYPTVGAGQNLQYGISSLPTDIRGNLVELIPYQNNEDSRHFQKDIDGVYLADITHMTSNTYGEEPISEEELLHTIVQIEELYYSGELNYKQLELMIKNAFDAHQGVRTRNIIKDTKSINVLATRYVIQALGRIGRTHIKSQNIYVYIDEKLLDKIDREELERIILTPEMKAILEQKKDLGRKYTNDEVQILNLAERQSTSANWLIHQMLSRNWNEQSMEMWILIRDVVLRLPNADANDYEREVFIRRFYITSGDEINQYCYSQFADFSDVVISFDADEIAFKNSDRIRANSNSDRVIICKVSEDDSGLPIMMKYPGMKEYFEERGYATSFEAKRYIMSPVLFHNIYKGALGEVAGEFILRRERNIRLSPIIDADKFEFFDYEMSPGVYVDFKNWKLSYIQDREKSLGEISRKLDVIGGKRVYIINIIGDRSHQGEKASDSRIIEIPGLLDSKGCVISDALDLIYKEDYE